MLDIYMQTVVYVPQLMKECQQSILKLTGIIPLHVHVHVLHVHVHIAGVIEINNK